MEQQLKKYKTALKRIQADRIQAMHMVLHILKQEDLNKGALAVYVNVYRRACGQEEALTKCRISNPRFEKAIREAFLTR